MCALLAALVTVQAYLRSTHLTAHRLYSARIVSRVHNQPTVPFITAFHTREDELELPCCVHENLCPVTGSTSMIASLGESLEGMCSAFDWVISIFSSWGGSTQRTASPRETRPIRVPRLNGSSFSRCQLCFRRARRLAVQVCLLLAALCWSPKGTSVKIGTIQRRLAWPLRKDDTQ